MREGVHGKITPPPLEVVSGSAGDEAMPCRTLLSEDSVAGDEASLLLSQQATGRLAEAARHDSSRGQRVHSVVALATGCFPPNSHPGYSRRGLLRGIRGRQAPKVP